MFKSKARMVSRLKPLFVVCLLSIFVFNCAKKGTITGGIKDEIPPVVVKTSPPNFSTNFNDEEIRIYFDEYIKLKDPQKYIIVSPPMDPKPKISPLGGASKYVKIEFVDTLLENTTYSINFGESIVDNNEGNPYSFYRYVFSTGSYLDSLSIKGSVRDAITKEVDPLVTVALYAIDEKYTDSLVFKEVPRYITSTSDSIADFNLENLKEGTYKLIALKDKVANYKFEPKQDKIGFYADTISLPADTATVFDIPLFKEILDFKPSVPKQSSKNSFIFGYEGNADSLQIELLSNTPENFETRILADKEKDSVHYWFKPYFEADSLLFEVSNKTYRDTIVARFKDQYKDSLQLSPLISGNLPFNKNFGITARIPFQKINTDSIRLMDQDSVQIDFTTKLDTLTNELEILFERTEENSYQALLLPEAIEDFIGNKNDSIYFNFRTGKRTDYGTVFLTVEGVEEEALLVQMITDKGDLIAEKTAVGKETLAFENLNPGLYDIRVIMDRNRNGQWDTGNFLNNLQPEAVFYYPEPTEVRANWELKQTFILE